MSHAHEGGQAPDQASSGRQTDAAAHTQTNHSQGTQRASHPKSHKQHGDTRLATAPDRPTQRVSQSLDAVPGHDRKKSPLGWYALECVLPLIGKVNVRTGDEVFHGRGDEDLF